MVNVHIAVTPLTAALFLDGDPISNPFITQLPSSRESRRLEARLEGYQDRSEVVSVRYPLNITWQLQEEPDEPEPVAPESVTENTLPTGRRHGRNHESPAVAAAPAEAPAPAALPRPAPPVVMPAPAPPAPAAGLKHVRFGSGGGGF